MYALEAATSADISSVLGILKTIVTWLFGCVSDVVEIVMAQPLLLIPIGVVMVYTIISVFRRLF